VNIGEKIEDIRKSEEINIYFCEYTDKYISYCPTICDDVADEIRNISTENLSKVIDVQQEEYNPAGALDDTVEICPIDDYSDIQELIDSFEIPGRGSLEPKIVKFFVFEFVYKGNSIYAIRRHNKIKSIRRGFIGTVLQDRFSKVTAEDIFGIDDQIDLLISGDEILIINHTSFERIFNITNEFIERAESVLDNRELVNQIVNFDQFKEDLLSNMNYVKRTAKLYGDSNVFRFLEEPESVERIIEQFNLGIEVNENGNYNYQDKSQAGELINFMQDSYYETLIRNEPGVDERR